MFTSQEYFCEGKIIRSKRSLFAEFETEMTVANIEVLRFAASRVNFADPFKYSPNKCHCTGLDRLQPIENITDEYLVCPKEGAMFLHMCHKAPIVFSEPHFYSADSEYTSFVKGLNPKREDHETYVQIEPLSGTPVEGYKRLQMNMYLRHLPQIQLLQNVSSGLMPLLWIEEGFHLGEEHMSLLVTFYHILFALNVVPWFLITIGVVIIASAAIFMKYPNVEVCNIVQPGTQVDVVLNHVAENGAYCNDVIKTISEEFTNPCANKDNINLVPR